MAQPDGPLFGSLWFIPFLDFRDGGILTFLGAVGSASIVSHQYRWTFILYLRVSISREDVFLVLLNKSRVWTVLFPEIIIWAFFICSLFVILNEISLPFEA